MGSSGEIRFIDQGLATRIRRVGGHRGDKTASKTVRDLLRERLMQLEIDGDPAALKPSPAPGSRAARRALAVRPPPGS